MKITKEEIKKGLEHGARITGNSVFVDAYKLIIEQEKEITELKAAKNDWKQRYESLETFIASSIECIDKKVKKTKIDMLRKLRSRISDKESLIQSYIADGCLTIEDMYTEIDEFIEEVENDK